MRGWRYWGSVGFVKLKLNLFYGICRNIIGSSTAYRIAADDIPAFSIYEENT